MQLNYRRTQVTTGLHTRVVFEVLHDGVVVDKCGSQAGAFMIMDALWAKRPESDRVAEYLWNLNHGAAS